MKESFSRASYVCVCVCVCVCVYVYTHRHTHTHTHTYRTNSDDDVHELLLDLVAAVDAGFACEATEDRKIPATPNPCQRDLL